MRKLLSTAAVLAVLVTSAQAQQFPSTNAEMGCVIIEVAVATRLEQLQYGQQAAAACRELKAAAQGDLNKCLLGVAVMRNRGRGRSDFDELPENVGDRIITGCLMLTNDFSEEQAKALVKRFFYRR